MLMLGDTQEATERTLSHIIDRLLIIHRVIITVLVEILILTQDKKEQDLIADTTVSIGKNLKIILAKFINKISFAKIINSN